MSTRPLAVLLAAAVAIALLSALTCGLLRAGLAAGFLSSVPVVPLAASQHAALMVGAFLGTVIAIERCVALKWGPAWLAPFASSAAGLAMLAGSPAAGAGLLVVASAVFIVANIRLFQRQRAWHTALLLAGGFAWFAGNTVFALRGPTSAAIAWWFAFFVATIGAERLEMARLMRLDRAARASLALLLGVAGASAALADTGTVAGVAFGASLVGIAGWLFRHDIAKRTVRAAGLARYMAICLLTGYAWLAIAGVAWAAWSLGFPCRDAALHAFALGFVFSMMMGHAPVILPAVARIKVRFGNAFYLPLAALHASLAVRLLGGAADSQWRSLGAGLNAAAIALFAATVAVGAARWRKKP